MLPPHFYMTLLDFQVWFDPGIGYVLPGEVIEFHKQAQVGRWESRRRTTGRSRRRTTSSSRRREAGEELQTVPGAGKTLSILYVG